MTRADAEHYTDVGSTRKPPLTTFDVPSAAGKARSRIRLINLLGLVDTHAHIV